MYTDQFITLHPGHSHVSNRPFGTTSMWGWGSAWRSGRTFVGKMEYGVRYKLWGPRVHSEYGGSFRECTRALFMMQRRDECLWSVMPDDVIMYVLNMCPWDWFADTVDGCERERGRTREPVVQRNRGDRYGGYYDDGGDDMAPGEALEEDDDDDDEEYVPSDDDAGERRELTREEVVARLGQLRGHPLYEVLLRSYGMGSDEEEGEGGGVGDDEQENDWHIAAVNATGSTTTNTTGGGVFGEGHGMDNSSDSDSDTKMPPTYTTVVDSDDSDDDVYNNDTVSPPPTTTTTTTSSGLSPQMTRLGR